MAQMSQIRIGAWRVRYSCVVVGAQFAGAPQVAGVGQQVGRDVVPDTETDHDGVMSHKAERREAKRLIPCAPAIEGLLIFIFPFPPAPAAKEVIASPIPSRQSSTATKVWGCIVAVAIAVTPASPTWRDRDVCVVGSEGEGVTVIANNERDTQEWRASARSVLQGGHYRAVSSRTSCRRGPSSEAGPECKSPSALASTWRARRRTSPPRYPADGTGATLDHHPLWMRPRWSAAWRS